MEQNKSHIYKADQINWEKLETVGISKSQIEKEGNLDLLLQGKETGIIPLRLKTNVFSLSMDATLKLEEGVNGNLLVNVNGITPPEN